MGGGKVNSLLTANSPVALPQPDHEAESQEVVLTRGGVRAHNAELHERLAKHGAVRVQVGYFRCPWPCTQATFERVRKAAVDRWVRYMESDGWRLVTVPKCRIDKRRQSYTTRGDWYSVPAFDLVEIPVAAAFEKLNLQIQRVEVPVVA